MKFEFIKNNKRYFIFTAFLVVLALLSIGLFGLKLNIDFKGGTVIEYRIPSEKSTKFKEVIDSATLPKYETVISKINNIERLEYSFNDEAKIEENIKNIHSAVIKDIPDAVKISSETISSDSAIDQTYNAFKAITFAIIGIIIFLSISFREVPKPFKSWQFGLAAVLSLLHDTIIVLGIFALLGYLINVKIDLLFVTAILTVIGFSVHDTIVVFDRVRENLIEGKFKNWKLAVDSGLNETVGRSVKLSLTAALVLLSLFVFGPESIKWFVGALLIGIISGTYSSIFVATQLLIFLNQFGKNDK